MPAEAAPGTVQLLGENHPLARAQRVRVLLDVLDVVVQRRAMGGFHVTLHGDGNGRFILFQLQQFGDVLALGHQLAANPAILERIDQAFREHAAQPDRLHPVFAAARQLVDQIQVGDQPARANGALRNVGRQLTVGELALGHHAAVATDCGQLQTVGIWMRFNPERMDTRFEGGHGVSSRCGDLCPALLEGIETL